MARYRSLLTCCALVACVGEVEPAAVIAAPPTEAFSGELGFLDVMTYNVKGLPWPLARNRPEALGQIAEDLAAMRRKGEHPHVVVLQEAFSQEARAIGAKAGYAYVVTGPDGDDRAHHATPPISPAYNAAASMLSGELDIAALDSGLMILSDFPVTRVEKLAFPIGGCAGFDCLASKGVLIGWLDLPGHRDPIAVATTHLNSKRSSGVPLPRANRAFAWQWDAARNFVAEHVPPDVAMVFAGDFNIGAQPERLAFTAKSGPALPSGEDALDAVLETGEVAKYQRAEALLTRDQRTDTQFYRSGDALRLQPVSLDIRFPEMGQTPPLSDHPGFTVRYQFEPK